MNGKQYSEFIYNKIADVLEISMAEKELKKLKCCNLDALTGTMNALVDLLAETLGEMSVTFNYSEKNLEKFTEWTSENIKERALKRYHFGLKSENK